MRKRHLCLPRRQIDGLLESVKDSRNVEFYLSCAHGLLALNFKCDLLHAHRTAHCMYVPMKKFCCAAQGSTGFNRVQQGSTGFNIIGVCFDYPGLLLSDLSSRI
eukprot:1189284-Prorocentrum_minimum.AAC.2